MILYLKDLENSTIKLLDITNSFSKVARYKINLQKSVAFLYEQTEKEYRKTIPKTKNLGIKLTKEVKDLYNENYKPLKKEIKEDLRRWKESRCWWLY
jgi:formyltetrahydrofolate synthetase